MTTTPTFLRRCEEYRERRGIRLTYLSRLLFDDGKVIDKLIADPEAITLRRLRRASDTLGEFERALTADGSSPVEAAA